MAIMTCMTYILSSPSVVEHGRVKRIVQTEQDPEEQSVLEFSAQIRKDDKAGLKQVETATIKK